MERDAPGVAELGCCMFVCLLLAAGGTAGIGLALGVDTGPGAVIFREGLVVVPALGLLLGAVLLLAYWYHHGRRGTP